MTKTDWQALADRIAREVMGWIVKYYPETWTSKARAAYFVPETIPTFQIYVDLWQPHNDVEQALMARDRIVEQGWDFVLGASLSGQCKVLVMASFTPEAGVGMFESERSAETDGKAICLAIERWLDAQKEKQDDSG